MARARVVAPVFLAVGLSFLQAEAQPYVTWARRAAPHPFARLEAPMAYDASNARFVLFGGYDHDYNRQADTWEFDPVSRRWTDRTPAVSPPRRSGHSLAYDPANARIILFGGYTDQGTYLGDTWEWNCAAKTWTNVTPVTGSPGARQGTQMIYDPSRGRILLFGGQDANNFYSQVWLWDPVGRSWSQMTTSVASSPRLFLPRSFAGMAYNTATNRPIVVGGIGFGTLPASGSVRGFQDIWELQALGPTSGQWVDRTPGSVGAHSGLCGSGTCPPIGGWRPLFYEPGGNRVVTYGGFNNEGFFSYNDTWAYSFGSSTWTQIATAAQGPLGTQGAVRDSHALVYDPVRSKALLFGGFLADMWELSGSTWSVLAGHNPTTGDYVEWPSPPDWHDVTYDPSRRNLLTFLPGSPEMYAFSPATKWTQYYSGSGPGSRGNYALAHDSVRDRTVLFGGRCLVLGSPDGLPSYAPCPTGGLTYSDTWSWNPANQQWANMLPGTTPPARYDHAMVYDAAHDRIVMFGGRNLAGTALSDTWLWNGANWAPGPAGPPARFGHGLAFDPSRNVVVLFGGDNGSSKLADTWQWNGSSWSNVTPGGTSPPPRAFAALGALGTRTGVLLFGGRGSSGLLQDAWTWDGAQWRQATQSGGRPSAREHARLVFLPAYGKLALFGGIDAGGVVPPDMYFAAPTLKGDMDLSDSTDLLLTNTSTQATLAWLMSGTTRTSQTSLSPTPAASERVVAVDDFDFDGRNDLVVWNSGTGATSFWLLNGLTRTGLVPLSTVATDWRLAASADFDHDSKPDLLWRNVSTQKLSIWLLNGTSFAGAMTPSPDQAIDANWEVVGALDANGDGNTDLLWYNPVSGKIVFWFMGYDVVRTSGQFANPSNAGNNNWKVLAAGDYGAGSGGMTGTKDLVWRNATSGRFVVWHMDNAGNRTFGTFTNPVQPDTTPTQWTITGPR